MTRIMQQYFFSLSKLASTAGVFSQRVEDLLKAFFLERYLHHQPGEGVDKKVGGGGGVCMDKKPETHQQSERSFKAIHEKFP